ncbi:uncharacterized protein LOC131595748 [Vicia villosa]|uniref:uncharacterized protein LOC131595748 n=1 Tax=Vicia villosa TaxID=3911 RepID=UPI00273BBAA9|nr:uncharacterized protein LOC131595748 [Vicia villosa]
MEIDELKSGMIKLTEMMQVLMARTDPPQRTVISEVSTAVVDPLQIFQPPVFSEPPPVVHTTAQAVPARYDNPLYDYRSAGSRSVSQGDCGEVEEVREQYQALEKRLRAMEGNNFFSVNADNMGLVSNLVMPSKFKNMAQKEKESFKEYAQRWRELASQVEPPLSEKELTSLFMDTLSPFFWEKMIGSVSSNFTDLVTIGQRLEEGIRKGKVSVAVDSSKKPFGGFQKKKENETNAVSDDRRRFHRRPQNGDQPYVSAVTPVRVQAPQPQVANQNQNRDRTHFDPIPMTYTDLYPALVRKGLGARVG